MPSIQRRRHEGQVSEVHLKLLPPPPASWWEVGIIRLSSYGAVGSVAMRFISNILHSKPNLRCLSHGGPIPNVYFQTLFFSILNIHILLEKTYDSRQHQASLRCLSPRLPTPHKYIHNSHWNCCRFACSPLFTSPIARKNIIINHFNKWKLHAVLMHKNIMEKFVKNPNVYLLNG